MKNIIFLTDIDNTLLYSYKHKREGDICVEYIRDKEQGYMSRRAYERWKELYALAEIVPVTTRSVEQYNRITWPDGLCPEYAITTNGGVLLHNGAVSSDDCGYFGRVSVGDRQAVAEFTERYREDSAFIRCREVDGIYAFVYCAKDVDVGRERARVAATTSLSVVSSGKKIYAMPRYIDKSSAAAAFLEAHAFEYKIGAGDSPMDVDMLALCDVAIAPNDIALSLSGNKRICEEGKVFIEFSVDEAIDIARRFSGDN